MMKSIDQTNALNTPVKSYKPTTKPSQPKFERTSAPDYRKLSQTPNRAASERISGLMQFGQPPKDERRPGPNKVPPKVSNRPALSRAKGTKEPIIATQPPLKTTNPTKKAPSLLRSQPISSSEMEPRLRNRFDHPLTERELNQLRLESLKGTDQKRTQALLQQLSGQSKQLAQQLSALIGSPRPPIKPEVPVVKSEPMVPVKTDPREHLTNELLAAQEDYRFLEEDYPKMKQEEQQAVLNQLREKYNAPKTSNPKHVQKIIRDRLSKIREEIQTL